MKKILVVLLAVAIALVGFGGGAEAATYHMNADASEDCQNLVECFTLLSEGDTLIIRDGVYTGYDNAMMHSPSSHIPPSGLGGDYITIKAENEGRVIFDGENERSMVYFNTGDPTFSYVIFEGIIWAHNRSDRSHTWAGLDHVKILRCGFLRTEGDGGASNFRLVDSSYVLVEECYSWGDGRYAFMTQTSDYIIFRRNVGRLDAANGGGMPISIFQNYCARNVEYQNNIAINTDSSFFSDWSYSGGGFSLRSGPYHDYFSEDISVRGNIALDIDWYDCGTHSCVPGTGFRPTRDNREGHDNLYEHNVAWDVPIGGSITGGDAGYTNLSWMTVKVLNGDRDVNDDGYAFRGTSYWSILNSVLIHGDRAGLRSGIISNYNVIWDTHDDYADGTVPGEFDHTVDLENEINPIYDESTNPDGGIRYIIQTEPESNLDSIANDGGAVGATIMCRYGVSGTLWGEPGYNKLTNETLWPFPYEDQIKTDLASYNPGGTDSTKPDGKRGFCADGNGIYGGNITLTSYIWEYLGNPCPAEICDYPSPYHQADLNEDWVINMPELMLFIARWKASDGVTKAEVEGVRGVWFAGGNYSG